TLPAPEDTLDPAVRSIWGSRRDDIWAVGYLWFPTRSIYEPRTWHYDGSTWSEVPELENAAFTHVSGTSRSDVWFFGYEPYITSSSSSARHWNGRSWETVEYPPYVRPLWVTPSGDLW